MVISRSCENGLNLMPTFQTTTFQTKAIIITRCMESYFFSLDFLAYQLFKNIVFRISNISNACPHAQLTCRTVMEKFWPFFGPWDRDRSQSPPRPRRGRQSYLRTNQPVYANAPRRVAPFILLRFINCSNIKYTALKL